MAYSTRTRITAISPTNMNNFHVVHVIINLMLVSWCHPWPPGHFLTFGGGGKCTRLISSPNGWLAQVIVSQLLFLYSRLILAISPYWRTLNLAVTQTSPCVKCLIDNKPILILILSCLKFETTLPLPRPVPTSPCPPVTQILTLLNSVSPG